MPGYCTGDLTPMQNVARVPVERGPRDLRELPRFFGRAPMPTDYGAYDIEIIAEINHCPRLSLAEILAQAKQLADDGADLIDVGCEPEGPWTGVADVVRALRDAGHRVSIDSLDPREIEPAVRAGAELVLSVNSSNREAARDWGCEVVVVPDDPRSLAGLDETVESVGRTRRSTANRSGAGTDRVRFRPKSRPISAGPRTISGCRNDDGHRQSHGTDRCRLGRHQCRAARFLRRAGNPQRADDASHQLGPVERAGMRSGSATRASLDLSIACCRSIWNRGW